jgi:hypothetical protein
LLSGAATNEKVLTVDEPHAIYGVESSPDLVTEKILLLLKDMTDEDRRAILKNVEEKKLLQQLMEERKKLTDVG